MTSLVELLPYGVVAAAVVSWLFAVVSYVQMMRTVPPAIARLHTARLRVRGNLLCFAAPQLFDGAGATWRRRYLFSLLAFVGSVVFGVVAALCRS